MADAKECLLSISYWGPIQYFTKFLIYDEITLELHENYQRKSYRNRCEVYGPNGKQAMQIPVTRGSFHKTNIQDLQISYDTDWQKNHFKTIETAYKSTPFYEYYEDDIIPFYENKFKYLKDFNIKSLELCLEWLEIDNTIKYTDKYQYATKLSDYRDSIHPKLERYKNDAFFDPKPYTQGFEQRHGFIPNLSILDLIFNLGPSAYSNVQDSIKNNQ